MSQHDDLPTHAAKRMRTGVDTEVRHTASGVVQPATSMMMPIGLSTQVPVMGVSDIAHQAAVASNAMVAPPKQRHKDAVNTGVSVEIDTMPDADMSMQGKQPCQMCMKLGHTAQSCPERLERVLETKKGRRCGVCQKYVVGHNAATCPERPAESNKKKRLRRCSVCGELVAGHNATTCPRNQVVKKRRRATRSRVSSGHRKAPAHGGTIEKHWPRRSPLQRGFTRRCARDGCKSRAIWHCIECSRSAPGVPVGIEDLVYLCVGCFEPYHTGTVTPEAISVGPGREKPHEHMGVSMVENVVAAAAVAGSSVRAVNAVPAYSSVHAPQRATMTNVGVVSAHAPQSMHLHPQSDQTSSTESHV